MPSALTASEFVSVSAAYDYSSLHPLTMGVGLSVPAPSRCCRQSPRYSWIRRKGKSGSSVKASRLRWSPRDMLFGSRYKRVAFCMFPVSVK
jgi:hypothetical protein